VPLCALAALGYYAYQRSEATAPAPPVPATREIRVQSPPATGGSPNSRDTAHQSPATGSSNVADPSVMDRAEKVPAPAGADAGINDGVRQAPPQSANKDASTPQSADSTAPAQQAEGRPRQKSRGVKRDNALAFSRPKSGEPAASGTARSFESREQGGFRPPAQCTDAVAALALCSRSNPNQGQ